MKLESFMKWIAAAALLTAQVGLVWTVRAWTDHRVGGIQDDLFAREAPQRKARAELLLNQAYLANHSIAQMAPVQAITGGNRRSANEDPVKQRRFSEEGAFAVQQLYNHVASTIPVSEIYCVLDGFSPETGEFPVFTLDHLITGDAQPETSEQSPTGPGSADEPEEVEIQEYDAYLRQLDAFRANFRQLDSGADEIYALSSGILRTCDNSQYPSISKSDVHNADGFVYSTPLQAPGGAFRGLVSTVFRSAAVEAYLLDVPFVPLTHGDSLAQIVAGFTLPDTLRTVLSHPATSLNIGDRRDQGMLSSVRQAKGEELAGTRRIRLSVTDESPWFLYWRPDAAPITAARKIGLILSIILSLLLWASAWSTSSWWRNRRRQAIHGQVSASSKNLLEDARALRQSGESLQAAQEAAVGVAQAVRAEAGSIRTHLGGLSTSSTEMAASAEEVATGAAEAARLGESADDAARSIAEHVEQLFLSGKEVARSIGLIADVADQIKLLSLNATLEAARAGAAGRGFSVVAAEIRSLAHHTTLATQSIEMVVTKIQQDIESTSGAARRVVDSLATVAQSQDRIAASAEQQRSTAAEVARAAEESVYLAGGIETTMHEAESSALAAQSLATETVERASSIMASATALESVAAQAATGASSKNRT